MVSVDDGVASMPAGRMGCRDRCVVDEAVVGTIEISVVWFSPGVVKLSVLGETCNAKLGDGEGGGPGDKPPQAEKTVSNTSTRTGTSFFLSDIAT